MDAFETEASAKLDRAKVLEVVRTTFLDEIESLQEVTDIAMIARLARPLLPIAVASGGPLAIVEPSLQRTGLLPLFRTIVTIGDVERPKPAPDLFLEAARRIGVSPAACLVIEDSGAGLDAAKAAQMHAIGVHDIEAVEALRHHLHCFGGRMA